MCNSPFAPYNGGYDDPEWLLEDDYPQETLRDKMAEADALFDLLSDMDEDEDEDTESLDSSDSPALSDPSAPTESSPAPEKTPSVLARFLSDLTDRVVEDGKLLLSEDGQAFAFQEDGGYYKPVTDLEAYLANAFPSKTTRSLHPRHLREIVDRLSWEETIRCTLDDFNSYPNLVNLQNGVFNLETSELLAHDPGYRFTYQIHASYLEDPSEVSCPVFEQFCKTSLDGDPNKKQLLLEFLGYICADTNAGKCALFFKGQPNSGKSVMSSLPARLFDKELVCNIPLHQLGDRFF